MITKHSGFVVCVLMETLDGKPAVGWVLLEVWMRLNLGDDKYVMLSPFKQWWFWLPWLNVL